MNRIVPHQVPSRFSAKIVDKGLSFQAGQRNAVFLDLFKRKLSCSKRAKNGRVALP